MLPGAHAGIGITIAGLLGFNPLQTFVCVLGSVIVDADFVLGLILNRNHRLLVTHTPFLWIVAVVASIGLFFLFPESGMLWVLFFSFILLHVFVDTIDWGVQVFFPFRRTFNPHLLREPIDQHLSSFLATYFGDWRVAGLEISLWVLGGFVLLLLWLRWSG